MTAEQMKYEFDVGYDRITNFDAPGYEPKEISTFLTRAQEELVYELMDASANKEKNRKSLALLARLIMKSDFSTGTYPNGFLTTLELCFRGGTGTDLSLTGNNILDSEGRLNQFRVGDLINVTGSSDSNNNGIYTITAIESDGSELTIKETFASTDTGTPGLTVCTALPVLKVNDERIDIELLGTNFYYGKIEPVDPQADPLVYVIPNIEVDPIDYDFYSANKDNPYKRPEIDKVWRLEYTDGNFKQHEYITDGTFNPETVYLHVFMKPRPIIVPSQYIEDDKDIDGIPFEQFPDGLDCQLDQIIHREIVDRGVKLAFAAIQDQVGYQISTVQEQQKQ